MPLVFALWQQDVSLMLYAFIPLIASNFITWDDHTQAGAVVWALDEVEKKYEVEDEQTN